MKHVSAFALLAVLAACSPHTPEKVAEASASAPASSAAPVAVADPLALKPGLWSVTYARPEMGYSSIQKICIDTDGGKTLAERNDELDAMPCSRHDVTQTADGIHIERVCTHNDTTVTSHIDIHGDGDGAFHQTMETLYDPAFAGHADTHTSADGAWVSTCPAGMKPGDVVMPDGSRATLR